MRIEVEYDRRLVDLNDNEEREGLLIGFEHNQGNGTVFGVIVEAVSGKLHVIPLDSITVVDPDYIEGYD